MRTDFEEAFEYRTLGCSDGLYTASCDCTAKQHLKTNHMKHGVDSRISKGVRLRGRAVKCASGLVPAQLREQRSRDGNDKDFFEGGHHPRTEAPALKWKTSVTS